MEESIRQQLEELQKVEKLQQSMIGSLRRLVSSQAQENLFLRQQLDQLRKDK